MGCSRSPNYIMISFSPYSTSTRTPGSCSRSVLPTYGLCDRSAIPSCSSPGTSLFTSETPSFWDSIAGKAQDFPLAGNSCWYQLTESPAKSQGKENPTSGMSTSGGEGKRIRKHMLLPSTDLIGKDHQDIKEAEPVTPPCSSERLDSSTP